MIQIITNYSIDDILSNPDDYIDSSEDTVLLKVFGKDISNPTLLMLGYDDESKSYYFVVEDNEVSEDTYCEINKLTETFETILKSLLKGDA